MEDALHRREKLPAGGAFVPQQGHLVSRVSVQLYAADSEQAGTPSARSGNGKSQRQLRAQQLMQSELQGELDQCVAHYQAAHQAAEQARIAAAQSVQEAHGFEVERMQLTQAEEQYSQRAAQSPNESSELRQRNGDRRAWRASKPLLSFSRSEDAKQGLQEALSLAQEKLELKYSTA
jgi:chromosome segregation protein